MNKEPLKMLGGRTLSINENSIIKIKNQNSGGRGTMQERKERFLSKARIIHSNKYDYSYLEYINRDTKVKIICPEHGEFLQTPHNHSHGEGCPICGEKIRSSGRASSTDEFIKKAKSIYRNKYDYSKFIYVRNFVKGVIICRKHGEFLQSPNNHLRGAECPSCYGTPKKTLEQFIIDANQFHNNKYDYSKVDYTHNKNRIIIICPFHGEFVQKPNGHLSGEGCPKCNSSKGELKIVKFLQDNNIQFQSQKIFLDCRNPKTDQMLKYDFYIPSKNLLIEYDGEQHFRVGNFRSFRFTKRDLKEIQRRDEIKTKYAADKGISLLRIKYTKLKRIEEILDQRLNTP